MNREIKFRAWDFDSSEMLYTDKDNNRQDFFFSFTEGNLDLFMSVEGDYPENRKTEIMQFTGLKDKNGIEIYEGDIVKIEFKKEFNNKNYINISEVIWSESSLRWDVPIENEAKHGLPLNWGGYESLEIIGNIYENKELLC